MHLFLMCFLDLSRLTFWILRFFLGVRALTEDKNWKDSLRAENQQDCLILEGRKADSRDEADKWHYSCPLLLSFPFQRTIETPKNFYHELHKRLNVCVCVCACTCVWCWGLNPREVFVYGVGNWTKALVEVR